MHWVKERGRGRNLSSPSIGAATSVHARNAMAMKRILAMLALLATRCDARGQVIAWEDERAEVLLAASDLPVPPSATLPKTFSWRRIAGYGSMLVASMNQHVPKYCGACFAFASFHALADRVKIARYLALRSGGDAFDGPDLVAAIQVMLNCGGDDEGWGVAGSCATGGSSAGVYRWVERFGGVPAAGCFPYLATDGLGCAPDTICRNCMPSNEDGSETECWAVPGCVEINHWFGGSPPNFRTLYLDQIEVDSADFWTNRLLSSSSRSTAEELVSKPSHTRTLKSG